MLLRALSELLGRSPDTIHTHYLSRMVKEGILELRFPDQVENKLCGNDKITIFRISLNYLKLRAKINLGDSATSGKI